MICLLISLEIIIINAIVAGWVFIFHDIKFSFKNSEFIHIFQENMFLLFAIQLLSIRNFLNLINLFVYLFTRQVILNYSKLLKGA